MGQVWPPWGAQMGPFGNQEGPLLEQEGSEMCPRLNPAGQNIAYRFEAVILGTARDTVPANITTKHCVCVGIWLLDPKWRRTHKEYNLCNQCVSNESQIHMSATTCAASGCIEASVGKS